MLGFARYFKQLGRLLRTGLGGPEEKWLPCVGFEENYEVSNMGRVRSRPRKGTKGGLLKSRPNRDGYPFVFIANKLVPVHRLVALAFHGHLRNVLHNEVAHLDGSRDNCCAENLKWVSHRENQSHKRLHGTHQAGELNPRSKLTDADVQIIRTSKETYPVLAERFGVTAKHISDIRCGKRWSPDKPSPPSAPSLSRWLCRHGHHSWRWHSVPRDGVWRYACRRCATTYDEELIGWS